ncbi:MAG: alpha-amylase family glycosyl hydrolase [Alphaproteobacteria bacterium]
MEGLLISKNNSNWWRGACIYQIYPRSFLDTNNDGIGDLRGITEKLEYVASLGVDAIWISPFFKSPMKDFGYDISDYRAIDPIFGTMDDFDNLLAKAHNLNLKIIIDLVLSHTSNEHPWFSAPDKKDWYVWADAKPNNAPPNNWVSVFGGSAWEWDENHKQYYFHNFLTEQPDLNFHNPDVQNEALDICKFWFDKGVDGLRLDVVNFYFHDQELRDNPPRKANAGFATQLEKKTPYSSQQHIYDKSRPENLEFLSHLRTLTDQYDNRVLIGEIGDDQPYKLAQEYTSNNKYLHTTYNPHMMSGTEKTLTKDLIEDPIETFFKEHNSIQTRCPSWAFSNHDVVRAASRWYKLYDHNPDFSKLLIALLGCIPGTVFLYQGEELGLPESKILVDMLQDPWAKETWPEWQGRDGCRTPIPWDNKNKYGGFSQNKPWLPLSDSHKSLNVQAQNSDQTSVLNFTRKLIKWRKNHPEIINARFEIINTSNSNIIHIRKRNSSYETNCIFNVSTEEISYNGIILKPYQFCIDGFEGNRK